MKLRQLVAIFANQLHITLARFAHRASMFLMRAMTLNTNLAR